MDTEMLQGKTSGEGTVNITYARNATNQLEIRFGDDSSFDAIKRLLEKDWSAKQIDHIGSFDQGWMDFCLDQQIITLHWDVFAGLCLISSEPEGEAVLCRIGNYLRGK